MVEYGELDMHKEAHKANMFWLKFVIVLVSIGCVLNYIFF